MVAYRRRLRKLDGRGLVNASRSGCSWPCTGNVEARYDRRDALHDVLGGTQMEAIGATRFLVGLASTALNLPLVLLFPIGLFVSGWPEPETYTAEEYAECLRTAGGDPDLQEVCALMKADQNAEHIHDRQEDGRPSDDL